MDSNGQIYIQSKEKISIEDSEGLFFKDLIEIQAEEGIRKKIEETPFELNHRQKGNSYIIPMISIIQLLKKEFPRQLILPMGAPEVIVNIINSEEGLDKFKVLRLAIVCFLLFIGSITAIINFHADVDMKTAHKTIYRVITGVEIDRPLLLQIPYSLGIGAGMSVFFNHVFKKRINNEPSPLEVEMYLYQQNMDAYLKDHEQNIRTKEKGSK
ncbi:stage V sporulation protein AA [Alkaliphilus hydrothermalis]|uniref:Stage V sporulation protein AA n=1 Tax=Alkaliphilus hydrothermalis TaxID=1482730 RepID=A0ABS2NL26_9FIRM|nr:stage V sporulation protein AA [Alkaliphilus hydrothermalis]MBM7613532.1 stage V sporulation protein AA [Alkaliphilus hydrothermalis]